MRMIPLAFAVAVFAAAQMTGPISVVGLKEQFIESIDPALQGRLLDQISRTPPATNNDIAALYDLFMRFPEDRPRQAAIRSLSLLAPSASNTESLFMGYLRDEEYEAQLFGIKGSLRLRSTRALPLIKKIAERKFVIGRVGESPLISERNAYSVQFEALAALAQWEGKSAMPLLLKKTDESARVAQILATHLWPESFKLICEWAIGKSDKAVEKAREAFAAEVPVSALRQTRAEIEKIVLDPKAPRALRHPLAVKLGLSSTPEEVASLLKLYHAMGDAESKLILSAALFASRDSQVIPRLTTHAKEHLDPRIRAGARVQLKDMLTPEQYRALTEWTAKSDPSAENRADAARELGLKR